MNELFEKCVTRKPGDGGYEIRCQLGLWGVHGPDQESVEQEAWRYWFQYFQDGEYAEHLLEHEQKAPGYTRPK
jgi:hypothetical protein